MLSALMAAGWLICQFVPPALRKNGSENARNRGKCVSFRVSICVSNDQNKEDFEGLFKAKNNHFPRPGAGSVPEISCVMTCVIYVSRNRGESGKKRENMTHRKYKRPCKSIIYKVS